MLQDIVSKQYDYIVVGGMSSVSQVYGSLTGGTAGCVLASRLSENPDTTVLPVERGPAIDSWISRVPLLSSKFRHPFIDGNLHRFQLSVERRLRS